MLLLLTSLCPNMRNTRQLLISYIAHPFVCYHPDPSFLSSPVRVRSQTQIPLKITAIICSSSMLYYSYICSIGMHALLDLQTNTHTHNSLPLSHTHTHTYTHMHTHTISLTHSLTHTHTHRHTAISNTLAYQLLLIRFVSMLITKFDVRFCAQ